MPRIPIPARGGVAALMLLATGFGLVGASIHARGGDAPDPAKRSLPTTPVPSHDEPHRSPIALALSTDGTRLLTANQTAGTVSLVDTKTGRVLHEVKTGDRPAGVALSKRRSSRRGDPLVRL